MAKERIQYYVNMGSHKELTTGYRINEELAYSTLGKEKHVTHLPTGMRVAYGKESVSKLVEKVNHLMEINKDMVTERLKNNNLDSLPTRETYESKLSEFLYVFNFEMPYDFLVLAATGNCFLDVIKMDHEVSKRKEYNSSLSLNENILEIYGEKGLELVEYFMNTDFLESVTN